MLLNKELYLIICPGLSLLFPLGGTEISSTIKGQKWLRRFLLPILWGAMVFLAGFRPWQALSVAGVAIVAFHLGYGTASAWWQKSLTFGAYGLISLPIGYSVWNLITLPVVAGLFILSNWKPTSGTVVHKVWEVLTGVVIGLQLGFLLSGYGFAWFS